MLNRPSCTPDDPIGQGTEHLKAVEILYFAGNLLSVLATEVFLLTMVWKAAFQPVLSFSLMEAAARSRCHGKC